MNNEQLTPEFLQVCTRAESTPAGSLTVVGITDTYRSEHIPVQVKPMTIVFRFRVPALDKVVGD